MTITFRERNFYSKGSICGCTNSRTLAYCQSSLCAELSKDGEIIYRGGPNKNISLDGSLTLQVQIPPLRVPGDNYDNVNNPSIGHRAPCNLQLEIYNSSNVTYCRDCQELDGIYDSFHFAPGSIDTNLIWIWPLCNPDKINNSCGASYVTGQLTFDTTDGFDPNTDTVRDIFFEIVMYSQGLFYNPTTKDINYQYAPTAGVMTRRMTKVGEIQWRKYNPDDPSAYSGYYDSNVNCRNFDNLEVSDVVSDMGLCDMNFKITSRNDDDLLAIKKTVYSRQFPVTYYSAVSSAPMGPHQEGLRYNYCQGKDSVQTPSEYGADAPTLTNETDDYWYITRVYNRIPNFWKVTISGAGSDINDLNGVHYLHATNFDDSQITESESESFTATKLFNQYESHIQPEGLYGDYKKIGCNCQNKITDPCLSTISMETIADDEEMNVALTISGRNDTYGQFGVRYTGTANHVLKRNFINPLNLTYSNGVDPAQNTLGNEHNLKGLTIVIENGNTYEDLTQTPCFLTPRNPICEGGKEPDAFLIEFTDEWIAGLLRATRPVFRTTPPVAECHGPMGGPPNKTITNCYVCAPPCDTNCNNQDWTGPVGSFILTKVDPDKLINGDECYGDLECNNAITQFGDDGLIYAYKNETDSVCSWSSITLRITNDRIMPCVGPGNYISISVFIDWAPKNDITPDVDYCYDDVFLAGSINCPQDASEIPHQECNNETLRCNTILPECSTPSCFDLGYGNSYFYANLPTDSITFSGFDTHYFADCSNETGYDLTWFSNHNMYQSGGCFFPPSYCGDETPGTITNLHGAWGGGTVKAVPIFY